MPLKERALDELKRGPITVTATVVGVLVAVVALLVAWLQYAGPPVIPAASTATHSVPSDFRLSNLLLVTSFFLASSLSLASLTHIFDRSHPFQAMVLSIPAAVLSAFFSLLVLQLAPVRPITEQAIETAMDTVFWATLFVFLAINGRSAAKVVVESMPARKSDSADLKPSRESDEGGGAIIALGLMLLIWGSLVSAGLSKMTQLFLL